jgi:hypothetical protein
MADDLGWEVKGFREAFGELLRQGLAKVDFDARVVWIPKAIYHNHPESPNVVRSWGKHWDEVPNVALKAEAYSNLSKAIAELGEGFAKAFREAFREPLMEAFAIPFAKGMPNQEQEQDQEQDQDQELRDQCRSEDRQAPVESTPLPNPNLPEAKPIEKFTEQVDAVVAHYRTYHPQAKPGHDVRKKITDRLRVDKFTPAELCRAVDGMHHCPHNLGQNERQRTYLELELAMRNSTQVNRYNREMDEWEKKERTGTPTLSLREATNAEAIKEWLRNKKAREASEEQP